MVVVTEPTAIEGVIRKAMENGGRGTGLEIIDDITKDHGLPYALGTANYEEWKKTRPLANVLLNPSLVNALTPRISSIASEWVNKLKELGQVQQDGSIVLPNLKSNLNLYTMENIVALTHGKRFGLTTPGKEIPKEVQQYTAAVEDTVARLTEAIIGGYWIHKYIPTKFYKDFSSSYLFSYNFAKKIRNNETSTPLQPTTDGIQNLGAAYAALAKKNGFSDQDVLAIDVGAVVAGVDTTSAVLMTVLYELAVNPSIQEELYQEVCAVMNVSKEPLPLIEHNQFKKMQILKNFVKDAIRKSPAASQNSRTLYSDTEVLGYHIPKNTEMILFNYGVNRDEKYFENPLQVSPHRFDKEDAKINEYSMLLFGLGERSCPGKRVAMAEVYMMVANLVYEYRLQCNEKDYELTGPGLLYPKVTPQNQIHFVQRSK